MKLCVVIWLMLLDLTLGSYLNQKVVMKAEMMEKTSPPLISKHLYQSDKLAHETVLNEIISEDLTNTNYLTVIQYVAKQPDEYLYHGFMKIFITIQLKELGDNVLVEWALHIEAEKSRGNVILLYHLFSSSMKALISSSDVYIKNKEYSEYLYACCKRDKHRHNVYTRNHLGEANDRGQWRFIHIQGNEFKIMSSKYYEVLSAEVESFNADSDRRRIFTKDVMNSVEGNVWAIEFDGNDVFIRNVVYNEYIYSFKPGTSNSLRRDVFAWIPKGRSKCYAGSNQCRWNLGTS